MQGNRDTRQDVENSVDATMDRELFAVDVLYFCCMGIGACWLVVVVRELIACIL